jgi:hypothetical protein
MASVSIRFRNQRKRLATRCTLPTHRNVKYFKQLCEYRVLCGTSLFLVFLVPGFAKDFLKKYKVFDAQKFIPPSIYKWLMGYPMVRIRFPLVTTDI